MVNTGKDYKEIHVTFLPKLMIMSNMLTSSKDWTKKKNYIQAQEMENVEKNDKWRGCKVQKVV